MNIDCKNLFNNWHQLPQKQGLAEQINKTNELRNALEQFCESPPIKLQRREELTNNNSSYQILETTVILKIYQDILQSFREGNKEDMIQGLSKYRENIRYPYTKSLECLEGFMRANVNLNINFSKQKDKDLSQEQKEIRSLSIELEKKLDNIFSKATKNLKSTKIEQEKTIVEENPTLVGDKKFIFSKFPSLPICLQTRIFLESENKENPIVSVGCFNQIDKHRIELIKKGKCNLFSLGNRIYFKEYKKAVIFALNNNITLEQLGFDKNSAFFLFQNYLETIPLNTDKFIKKKLIFGALIHTNIFSNEIKRLNLTHISWEDLRNILSLKNLEYLSIDNTSYEPKHQTYPKFSEANDFQSLSVNDLKLKSVKELKLKGFNQLQEMTYHCGVLETLKIENCPVLKSLIIDGAFDEDQFFSFGQKKPSSNLKKLVLESCLPALEELVLKTETLEDLDFLKLLPNLKIINKILKNKIHKSLLDGEIGLEHLNSLKNDPEIKEMIVESINKGVSLKTLGFKSINKLIKYLGGDVEKITNLTFYSIDNPDMEKLYLFKNLNNFNATINNVRFNLDEWKKFNLENKCPNLKTINKSDLNKFTETALFDNDYKLLNLKNIIKNQI